jgi:hypothetical protein
VKATPACVGAATTTTCFYGECAIGGTGSAARCPADIQCAYTYFVEDDGGKQISTAVCRENIHRSSNTVGNQSQALTLVSLWQRVISNSYASCVATNATNATVHDVADAVTANAIANTGTNANANSTTYCTSRWWWRMRRWAAQLLVHRSVDVRHAVVLPLCA